MVASAEQYQARKRGIGLDENLTEVGVRLYQDSVMLNRRLDHCVIVGAKEREISDMNCVMAQGAESLCDPCREALVNQEPHPDARASGISRILTASAA